MSVKTTMHQDNAKLFWLERTIAILHSLQYLWLVISHFSPNFIYFVLPQPNVCFNFSHESWFHRWKWGSEVLSLTKLNRSFILSEHIQGLHKNVEILPVLYIFLNIPLNIWWIILEIQEHKTISLHLVFGENFITRAIEEEKFFGSIIFICIKYFTRNIWKFTPCLKNTFITLA